MKKNSAFSGLEAAIVLIAFVVVAAVFSYVMLGAGFFATQKSQEVTYSGIKQSTSNMVLDGTIYGSTIYGGVDSKVHTITFYLTIPEGGQAQNMDQVDYTVTVRGEKYIQKIGAAIVDDTDVGNKEFGVKYDSALTDGLLQPGNTVKMEMFFSSTALVKSGPVSGDSFTIEIKPKVGAASLVSKTLVTGYRGGAII